MNFKENENEIYIKSKIENCLDQQISGFKQTNFSTTTSYAEKIKKVCKEKGITPEHIKRFSKYSNGQVYSKVVQLIH